MKCSKCGSDRVNVQIVPVNKRVHYTFKVFWQTMSMYSPMLAIFLLIPLIGWGILLIIFLRGYKISSEEWAVCQECGYKEKIGKDIDDKEDKCLLCGYPLKSINYSIEQKKKIERGNPKLVARLNIALGIFGVLMLSGVLTSAGGISGNANAAIVSASLVIVSIISVISVKERNKILTYVLCVPYGLAVVYCASSIRISSSYLVLEAIIVVVAILTMRNAKKTKII